MIPLRKPNRRESLLLAALLAVGGAGAYRLISAQAAAPLARARKLPGDIPSVGRIDLARLERPTASIDAGRRDLFAFGPAAPVETPAPTPTLPPVVAPPPSLAGGTGGEAGPSAIGGAAPLPPLNVKYIGSVENAHGAKVAVLLTDRQEVLTGQTGQVIANRYRVARIGLESVDLEDVATGQSRRVALRGS